MVNESKTKITAPVSIEDVRQVLIEASHDLGTLCKSEKINPFARFKPVRLSWKSTTNQFVNGKWQTKLADAWYKGADGNCGLQTTKYTGTQLSALIASYNGKMNGWAYQPVQGGNGSPYRLTDFVGYNKQAEPPVTDFVGTEKAQQNSGTICTYNAFVNDYEYAEDEDRDNVSLADMAIGNYYFGVLLAKGTLQIVVTDTKTLAKANGGCTIEFSCDGLSVGEWNVYPVASSVVLDKNSTIGANAEFVALPNLSPVKLTIQAQAVSNLAYGFISLRKVSATRASFTFDVANTGNASSVAQSAVLQVEVGTGVYGTTSLTIPAISAGETKTLSGTIDTTTAYPITEYEFRLYVGGKYTTMGVIEDFIEL